MKIIRAGAGEVGTHLAKMLSQGARWTHRPLIGYGSRISRLGK